MLSGTTHVSWVASDNSDEDLNGGITLSVSSDNGQTWRILAGGIANSGTYAWDTLSHGDGAEYVLKVTARDSANNSGYVVSHEAFTVDNTPPEVLCEAYGERGKKNWYVNATMVTLSGDDALSEVTLYYNLAGQWREYTHPVMVHKEGRHNFSYYGADAAGNRADTQTVTLKLDATPPNISFTIPEEDYLYFFGKKLVPLPRHTILIGKTMVALHATDTTSGISHVAFNRDGTHLYDDIDEPYEWEWTSPLFTHELTCTAYDHAGNHAQITQTIFSLAL
jgi:hypothetical protein